MRSDGLDSKVHMMDQHDEAHIDLAHRERRRASKLLKALRFEEALAAHDEAISHLEKVILIPTNKIFNIII